MNRFRILAITGLAIIAAAVLFVFLRDASDPETVDVERGSIDVSISTVGTIQLNESAPLRTEVGGTVAALGADVGDMVEPGDVLVLLDQEELRAAVDAAESNLEAAEFGLQFAELRLEEDEDSLDLSQDALEAQRRVDLARAALDDAEMEMSGAAITADRAGTVLEIFVEPGDRVGPNQPAALLYSPDDLVLSADVDELDLPNVGAGSTVRFRLDAYPATEIEGTVSTTTPQAAQRGGATLFPAEVDFDAPEGLDIRPGMNADVSIVTDLREDVLLVPERALRTVGQRAFALVERGGEFVEVEVILGYRSGGMAEIVDGLEEGDRVELR